MKKAQNSKKGGQGQPGNLSGGAQKRKKKSKTSTTLVWALRTYNSWSPLPSAKDKKGIPHHITFGTWGTTLRERKLKRVKPEYLTRCEEERTRGFKLRLPLSDEKLLKAYKLKMRVKRETRERSSHNIIEAAGVSPTRKTTANQRQKVAVEGRVRRATVRQDRLDEAARTFDPGAQRTCIALLVLLSLLPQAVPIAGAALVALPALALLLLTLTVSNAVVILSRRWEIIGVSPPKKVLSVVKKETHHEKYIRLRLEVIALEKKATYQINKEGWNTRRGRVRDATWLRGTATRCLVALTVLPTIWSPPSFDNAPPCLALLLVAFLALQLMSIASD